MNDLISKEISNDLLSLLFDIHNKLFNFSEMMRGDVFPPSHVKTIFYLYHKKSMSISNMARCLDISKPNMTPIIDKLIEEGLVTRYTNPSDRRKINVELTDKGVSFIKERHLEVKSILANKISSLEVDDLEKFSTLINDMKNIISKLK